MANLYQRYVEEIRPALQSDLGLANIMQIGRAHV